MALLFARLGRKEEALGWARAAISEKQHAFASHQLLHFLNQPDDHLERAEQLEAFGHSSAVPAHRTELFFEAGSAFDLAEDPERAAECYAQTLQAAPDHREAFSLLCDRREAQRDLEAVEKLILLRLGLLHPGSAEHLALELKLAALLSTLNRPEDAKRHLEEALSAHPDHSGALRSHAEVSAQLGAHDAAEKSLVALRDRLNPGDERTEVMRSLARLYDEHLGQREKAMDAYQAVLQEAPDDEKTRSDLVRIYSHLGLAERATVLQTKIIQEATTAEKKRDGALRLAEIYETVAGDAKRAGATLERTRKAWPLDGAVLEATVHFMDRQGTGGPRGFLLDRADKDARRQLESGRLDAGLLDTLARVARLSDRPEQSKMTDAARHAYLGSAPDEVILGGGLAALSPKVDEIISPSGFGAPLRALLRKTGAAMDAAFSVDLANLGARPCTSGKTFERILQIAQALESDAPQLFVAERLGAKCLPITTQPARLLIGIEVDEIPEAERDYLLLRALKLRWLGAGAFARSKDEDRFPMLVALLHLFAPNWRPTNVDGRKAAQAKALIEQGLARVGYDDDVPMLALEVIGALGNQGSSVGDQPRILANRVALLGMGDPRIPMSAMAVTEGAKLAAGGPSRFRFIESHPEAKDLLLFSTTEECAQAREALGLGVGPGALGSGPDHSGPNHPPPGQESSQRDARPAPPRRPKPPPPKRS
jgi:tetratricopeptide (TPR) repeat protein